MKEIYAGDMDIFFEKTRIPAVCTYNKFYKLYDCYLQVWEVSDDDFKKMCDMTMEEFVELAGQRGWWRSADGSNLGVPDAKYRINDVEIIAWDGFGRNRGRNRCFDICGADFDACTEADFEKCIKSSRTYKDLLTYLCDEVGASLERNVCACAIDLAKYNDMTLGELFTKLQPGMYDE